MTNVEKRRKITDLFSKFQINKAIRVGNYYRLKYKRTKIRFTSFYSHRKNHFFLF